MNSHESIKGFISFIVLSAVVGLSVLSLRYISKSTNLISIASNEAVSPKFIEVDSILSDSATINWYTNTETIGIIIYSSSKSCFEDKKNNYQTCELTSENNPTKNHQLKLNNLQENTTYYYKIKGDNFVYPEDDTLAFSTQELNNGFASPASNIEDQSILPLDEASDIITNTLLEETPKQNTSGDYDGFGEASTDQVLGISTSSKLEKQISAGIIDEFREALIYNNTKYDFNQNGIVENADYPLYIEFIKNQED